jgi:preprotein translocase subunit SecY
VFICGFNLLRSGVAQMSAAIDDDPGRARRLGLAGGFAEGPTGSGPGGRAELWRRLWFTLGALIVYRLGTSLPLPGLDMLAWREFLSTSSSGILGLLDMFAGGAISGVSIFALGIMPYISAFIIVEVVSRIVPRLSSLASAGSPGRRRLNQYARILTVALAALQAAGIAFAPEGIYGLVTASGAVFEVTTVLTLVAGAIYVMWLAEQISARGIGNGAMVIFAFDIAGRLPRALTAGIEYVRMGDVEAIWLIGGIVMVAAIVWLVVVVEQAARRIAIHDPGGAIGVRSAIERYAQISLKPNPTGVFAPLAASVLAVPLSGLLAAMLPGLIPSVGIIGFLWLEALLIALFAVFFGLAAFSPEEMARQLQDSGGFVPGYRSGENTACHLRAVQSVLVGIGTVYLVAVCVGPQVIFVWLDAPLFIRGFEIFFVAWVMVRILEHGRVAAEA